MDPFKDYGQIRSMTPADIKNNLCKEIGCNKKDRMQKIGFTEIIGRLGQYKFKTLFYSDQKADSPDDCVTRCNDDKNKCFLATYSYENKNCYLYDKDASKNKLKKDKKDRFVSYREKKHYSNILLKNSTQKLANLYMTYFYLINFFLIMLPCKL